MDRNNNGRRLFVGDLHGCLRELDLLLNEFRFRPGVDTLFSVGDVIGKGPEVAGTLRRLRELNAGVVCGNHDQHVLTAWRMAPSERKLHHSEYLRSLGNDAEEWLAYIASWPTFLEMDDVILVHAGLEPGQDDLTKMHRRILTRIRTWDGKGEALHTRNDPPWFECVHPVKTVVFGHWAERGLVDLSRFKGLDTGCVYGRLLTGWCPEENRFLQVKAEREYAPIHYAAE